MELFFLLQITPFFQQVFVDHLLCERDCGDKNGQVPNLTISLVSWKGRDTGEK